MGVLANIETVLITGASGGIGEAFARKLAELGKSLILVARSEEKLAALAEELASMQGVKIHVIVADLARPDSASAIHAETEHLGLVVDLLVNNAGFAKAGEFAELPFEVQADMVRLNVNTLTELTWLYLPAMRQKGQGGVINLGSTASFQPVPYMAVYGATKAFVLSLSEAVAEEVASDGVTVMALCPGPTATDFYQSAGAWEAQRDSMVTPDKLVADALDAFEQRRHFFVHGGLNKLAAIIARITPPRLVTYLAARVVGTQR